MRKLQFLNTLITYFQKFHIEKITHFYFLNLLTWYEVETNTENNPCLIGKSWISSRDIFSKRFLVRKLYTSHVTKMLTSCIVSPHQGLLMVKFELWIMYVKKPYLQRVECCMVMKSYMQVRNVWFYCHINLVGRISVAGHRWFWIFLFYVLVAQRCVLWFH